MTLAWYCFLIIQYYSTYMPILLISTTALVFIRNYVYICCESFYKCVWRFRRRHSRGKCVDLINANGLIEHDGNPALYFGVLVLVFAQVCVTYACGNHAGTLPPHPIYIYIWCWLEASMWIYGYCPGCTQSSSYVLDLGWSVSMCECWVWIYSHSCGYLFEWKTCHIWRAVCEAVSWSTAERC